MMDTEELIDRADRTDAALEERVRRASATLEEIGADWTLLERLPTAERDRLHKAVARLHEPDPIVRRRRLKEARRQRKAAENRREDQVLHGTGIRTLRRKPVFTTPNVFPPLIPLHEDSKEETQGT